MRFKGLLVLLGGLLFGVIAGVLVFSSGPRYTSETTDRSPKTPAAVRRSPPTTGSPAPEFTLLTLEGEITQLSDYAGRPVVLNFWATWCPPCRQEMPLLAWYAQEYNAQIAVIGINIAEDEGTVREFTEFAEVAFPILIDRAGQVSDAYYVSSYPATFFIDAEGVVRAQHIGALDDELMQKYLGTVGVSQ